MPSIKNIDKFVQQLNSLGDEPRILKERGEVLEPATVPVREVLENNPFDSNIEDSFETPDLSDALDPFDDLDDDLFSDDDLDISNNDAPDLEVDDSFNLDDIEEIDSLDDLDPIEDIDGLDDIKEIDSLDDLDPLADIDGLDDIEEIDSLDDLDPIEDIDGLDDIEEIDSLDDLDPIEDIDGLDDIDSLEELEDLDLDTSPDTLDDNIDPDGLNISDVSIDDIGFEDDDLDIPEGFDDLSIEDEVLEDDFGSLEDDDTDQFSLGDFGDSFNLDKEASSTALNLEEFSETEEEDDSEDVQEINYTKEEFEQIKKTLFSLPLNLKIVIEEEIAENGLFGAKLERLMELLIKNASVKDIVKYVNKKLGHKIKISSSFVKLTALELENKKKKFAYIFVNQVIPKLIITLLASISLSLLFLAVYFWVYKVVKSENIYKEGQELILVDKYEEAYDKFLEAFNTHKKQKWYYIYADTYRERKAYDYAEIVYLEILNEDSKELRAVLSYSQMKGFDQAEYAKATNFIINYIDQGYKTYDLYITLGDLYMKWGVVDSNEYENARLWYSEVMNAYGPKPPVLFKFLDYFVATDNLEQVLKQRRMYEISTNITVNGDSYARMAGYLIDKGIVENVRETLFRGIKDNPRNPNIHYQLARYFNTIGNSREVEKALRNAAFYYSYGGALTLEELTSFIDTKRLLGDLYSKDERYIASEQNYSGAATLYENLRDRNIVDTDEKYGEIYSGYGDIFYYAGNSYTTAKNLYAKAEDNGFSTPELSYKKGYIDYEENDMESALYEFHKSEDIHLDRQSILFAKANTLAYRGSYSSAITYYKMFLRILEKLESEHETLYPGENDEHLALIENYIKVYNNMGVALYNLNGEKALPEVGMAFTKSTEYYDYLTRDPDFLIRSGRKDLAYYNTKAVLFPDKNMELLLYNTIAKDFNDLNLGVVLSVEK